MTSSDDIKRLFQSAELSTRPGACERVFQDVLDAYEQTITEPSTPEKWRFTMRHLITKRYAAAAAVVLAVTIVLGFFNRTVSVSWAIEQSVAAMSRYHALFLEGSASERIWTEGGALELQPIRVWAVADANQTRIEKYRFELDGVTMLVTDGQKTWKYEPQAHRVTIKNQPYVASEFWLGSGFLEQLKKAHEAGTLTCWEETYGEEPVTGRRQVLLGVAWLDRRWNGPRSVQLVFDVKSRLLVSMKQWENADWEGPASAVVEKITFSETLPDTLFEFQIPAGATVQER